LIHLCWILIIIFFLFSALFGIVLSSSSTFFDLRFDGQFLIHTILISRTLLYFIHIFCFSKINVSKSTIIREKTHSDDEFIFHEVKMEFYGGENTVNES
jgi:hypothetical protein